MSYCQSSFSSWLIFIVNSDKKWIKQMMDDQRDFGVIGQSIWFKPHLVVGLALNLGSTTKSLLFHSFRQIIMKAKSNE